MNGTVSFYRKSFGLDELFPAIIAEFDFLICYPKLSLISIIDIKTRLKPSLHSSLKRWCTWQSVMMISLFLHQNNPAGPDHEVVSIFCLKSLQTVPALTYSPPELCLSMHISWAAQQNMPMQPALLFSHKCLCLSFQPEMLIPALDFDGF